MSARIVVGSLAPQNWHRQARRVAPERRFDFVFDKTVEIQRRFGFRPMGIDFSLTHLPSNDPVYLDELAARLRQHGLVPAVGFGQMRLSNDPEVRDESVRELERGLELVARLGARRAFCHPAYNGRVAHEGRIRYCAEILGRIAPAAAGLGLQVTQENYDYFRADDLVRICQAVGQPHVGVHSDTGNWLILGEDPVEATRKVLPYTLHAHVRDYAYENDTYNGVALGDGLVDFERVLPLLASAPVDEIVFSMEVDTDDRDEDDAAERSYVYLRDWLARHAPG